MSTKSESVRDVNRPFIVPKLEHPSGGVDFLGLRQVNLDLMGECLPGVNNNATTHIRPFSVLSWIHWKYHAALVAGGERQATKGELRRFQEKVETLFTWGHKLANIQGVPGGNALCPNTEEGWADLSFAAWKRSAHNTSLQAAVQYGPAFKSRFGLGFAEAVDGVFSRVTPIGEEMAKALDVGLSGSQGYELVSDLDVRRARAKDADELLLAWQVDKPSQKEQEVFRSVFFDPSRISEKTDLGKRSATIQAIIELLRTSSAGLSEEQIRHGLARQYSPSGQPVKLSEPLQSSAKRWLVLQVRQAQRAALECLLSWFEMKIQSGVRRIEDFHEEIKKALKNDPLSEGGRAICGVIKDRFLKAFSSEDDYRNKCALGDGRCFFALTNEVFDALDNNPGGLIPAISALLIATIGETLWLQEDSKEIKNALAHGGAQRISLAFQCQHFMRHENTLFPDWLSDILERWIISQHLYTATYRFDGKSQRLRFTFDEDGLEFLADKPLEPNVSLDHLAAALSLMAECLIVNYDPISGHYLVGT